MRRLNIDRFYTIMRLLKAIFTLYWLVFTINYCLIATAFGQTVDKVQRVEYPIGEQGCIYNRFIQITDDIFVFDGSCGVSLLKNFTRILNEAAQPQHEIFHEGSYYKGLSAFVRKGRYLIAQSSVNRYGYFPSIKGEINLFEYNFQKRALTNSSLNPSLTGELYGRSITSGDLNGDMQIDLVYARGDTLVVFLATATGFKRYDFLQNRQPGYTNLGDILLCDLTGDRLPEIICGYYCSVWRNRSRPDSLILEESSPEYPPTYVENVNTYGMDGLCSGYFDPQHPYPMVAMILGKMQNYNTKDGLLYFLKYDPNGDRFELQYAQKLNTIRGTEMRTVFLEGSDLPSILNFSEDSITTATGYAAILKNIGNLIFELLPSLTRYVQHYDTSGAAIRNSNSDCILLHDLDGDHYDEIIYSFKDTLAVISILSGVSLRSHWGQTPFLVEVSPAADTTIPLDSHWPSDQINLSPVYYDGSDGITVELNAQALHITTQTQIERDRYDSFQIFDLTHGESRIITIHIPPDSSPDTSVDVCQNQIFPPIITPNGDWLNDSLYFKLCPDSQPQKIDIFHPWGYRIRTLTQPIEAYPYLTYVWDGKNEERRVVPRGSYYFFVFDQTQTIIQKGAITVFY